MRTTTEVGRCMFIFLCPCSGLAFWARLGAGGQDPARGGLERVCNSPGQVVQENHNRRFCFLHRIQLVWTRTTALQLASHMKPLLEYKSCPGTLALVAQRWARYCWPPDVGRCGRSEDRVSVNCPLVERLHPAEWRAEKQLHTVDYPT